MNKLYVGPWEIPLPKADFIFIGDDIPLVPPQARIFLPGEHSFNPLKGLDYRKSCTIVDIFDALFDPDSNTLTKTSGLDYISEALEAKPRFLYDLVSKPDKKSTTGHIWAYSKIQRILRSPILKSVLCDEPNFHLNKRSVIAARLNRAEIGDFDALVIGLFLTAQFKGQVILDDGGFYLRNIHMSLIREERLILGVRTLSQIKSATLRDECLLMEKVGQRTTVTDARTLMDYEGTPENEQAARLQELIG